MYRGEHQKALEEIKHYLVNPPVLVPPQKHEPFKLYLSADERAIGSALIQEFEGKERAIYFMSRRLLDAETREFNYFERSNPMLLRFLEILCW